MSKYFEGWYLKHQKDGRTLALIPGRSDDEAFIQVIDDEASYYIPYPLKEYSNRNGLIKIAENQFSREGVILRIDHKDISLNGNLRYNSLTPIAYDIMGPFRFFPMECKHSVISMDHTIQGEFLFNDQRIDFNRGRGYIESDRGKSFPESYLWTQANDFDERCSVMVAIAKIPFAGLKFWGCISVVWYRGREYRLATYRGVKVRKRSRDGLFIQQGKYRLVVDVPIQNGYALYAPDQGSMLRTIHEVPSCTARYRFYLNEDLLFDKTSHCASYEFAEKDSGIKS